jgi:hypothetical protein
MAAAGDLIAHDQPRSVIVIVIVIAIGAPTPEM